MIDMKGKSLDLSESAITELESEQKPPRSKFGMLQPRPKILQNNSQFLNKTGFFKLSNEKDATNGKNIVTVLEHKTISDGVVFKRNNTGEVIINRYQELGNEQNKMR